MAGEEEAVVTGDTEEELGLVLTSTSWVSTPRPETESWRSGVTRRS